MIFDILNGGFTVVETIIVLAAFVLAIIIAITFHEYSHALAALKAGDPSARNAGRLTLNPAAHFEPLGLVCFLFAGIGWAKPVPVNPFNYRNYKRGNFWVSISGVLTNIFIGFACSFVFYLLVKFELFIILPNGLWAGENIFWLGVGTLFLLCMVINISLAVFNLLPIPPLDGYNLLASFTKPNNRFMKVMRENGMIILLLFVLFGGFIIFEIRGVLMDAFIGFWGLFI